MPREGHSGFQDLSVAILRQVVVPIHAEGYSPTETAKRLEISPSSVPLLADYVENELGSRERPDAT